MSSIQSDFTLISLDSLRTGVALHAPIYDATSNPPLLLLSNGTMLTESLLGLLRKRGIKSVRVSKCEVARLLDLNNTEHKSSNYETATKSGIQDKKSSLGSTLNIQHNEAPARTIYDQHLKLKQNSFFHKLNDQSGKEINPTAVLIAKQKRDIAAQKIDAIYQDFANGNVKSIKVLTSMTGDSLLQIAEDMDIFISIGLNPREKGYPSRHSLQMATMAMAIGTLHGLSKDELIELGIGCLIHDAGMLFLEDKSYITAQEFGLNEHLEITKHPLLTQELFKTCSEIPKPSMMISYQMHERSDGSGYPRGRTGAQIHYLAKIAMVADVYVALTSDRPHRNAYHPYLAMEQILFQTNQGKFDPHVVRSLLNTISLFPIGSFVQLSDLSPARVIRANRTEFMKPVVEIWDWKNLNREAKQINLQEHKELVIRRPLEEFPLRSPTMA